MSITTDQINFPYSAVQLTGTINRIPNLYGLLNDLDVFPGAGSISTVVEVRREENTLAVLPMVDRGGPPTVAKRTPGDALYFEIPHFPFEDTIGPQDLQNMLTVVGTGAHPRTFEEELAKRLFKIRNVHAITLEWVRMGALKGLITDGKGNTVYDLFVSFNFTKPIIYFDLSNGSADIDGQCQVLFETIATNLRGETMSYIEVIVSPSFFNKFIGHAKVQKFWLNWQAAQKLAQVDRVSAGGQMGRVFDYQQIRWREYYGLAPVAGASTPFVAANKGHARPVGTMDTFKTHFAPANDIRFVNTPGQEVYISPEILEHGQGVELLTQSNPLAICRRPEVLVEVDAGASP